VKTIESGVRAIALHTEAEVTVLLLLLLLLTAIKLPLGASSPYTSTDKTNNKYK
jgi:hypothetical protein